MNTLPTHLEHLTDGQILKLISYIGGHETCIEGCEYAMETMRYRIVPKKKLLYMVTADKVYADKDAELHLIATMLNFIAFAYDVLQKDYPADKVLNSDDRRSKEYFEKERFLSLELRKSMNLTPAYIVHVLEDTQFVGTAATETLYKFFGYMVSGKLFISVNSEKQTATISRWEHNGVVNDMYALHPDYRNRRDAWQHLIHTPLGSWSVGAITQKKTPWTWRSALNSLLSRCKKVAF